MRRPTVLLLLSGFLSFAVGYVYGWPRWHALYSENKRTGNNWLYEPSIFEKIFILLGMLLMFVGFFSALLDIYHWRKNR